MYLHVQYLRVVVFIGHRRHETGLSVSSDCVGNLDRCSGHTESALVAKQPIPVPHAISRYKDGREFDHFSNKEAVSVNH
jgi:hypothetical protein